MDADMVSLAFIALVAFLCPLLAQAIPGRPISETVFLLAAGAALGPHALGLIDVSESITLLSDLGLGALFLLAGYEINPSSLTGHQGKRGLATWFFTLVLAFVVVIIWPTFSARHIDGIAVAIALTTTAIGTLLPILQERGLTGTRLGDSVLAYGTWGELCPILAMTLLLSTRAEWQTILILVLFLVIAVLAGAVPKRARKAGSRVFDAIERNANTNSQLVVRAVVVLLVTLTTVSALFDLDIVLGAFAAGFVLRYVIPEGSPVMEAKITSISFGFFIPLFFIVSGAKIDVTAIADQPLLLVEFIILLLFVRALPIFVSLSTDRETRDMVPNTRLSVALYCTTALPLIVAVTAVAVNAGAMTQETASVLVAAGGVTVLIMPVLGQTVMRTINAEPVRAAKQIAKQPRQTAAILREHRNLEKQRHIDARDELRQQLASSTAQRARKLGLSDADIEAMLRPHNRQ